MIPVEMASVHGVLVANVPGVNAVSVAEHVLLKLLQRRSTLEADVEDLKIRKTFLPAAEYAKNGYAVSEIISGQWKASEK